MHDRLAGLLLFLPVPVVLLLFTQAPLGILPSIGLGVLVMGTHRFYARPFARGRSDRRCLWCGGSAGIGEEIVIAEPGCAAAWRTCDPQHGELLARVLGWANRHAPALRVGILGTLIVFLCAALGVGSGKLTAITWDDAVAFFRAGIALSVLPLGWLSARNGEKPAEEARSPFPLHVQSLVGTRAVLWLFRLVGIAWMGLAIRHCFLRLY